MKKIITIKADKEILPALSKGKKGNTTQIADGISVPFLFLLLRKALSSLQVAYSTDSCKSV